jgi:hypothetical protein
LGVDAEFLLGEEFGNLNNWTAVNGTWTISDGIL